MAKRKKQDARELCFEVESLAARVVEGQCDCEVNHRALVELLDLISCAPTPEAANLALSARNEVVKHSACLIDSAVDALLGKGASAS